VWAELARRTVETYAARMAKAHEQWTVLDHGPIEKLAENLWWVQGALPGMSLKRTMVVARMNDGRLVIHNAIALREDAMKELEAWGTPAFLIVPNGIHRLDAPSYKRRYPKLTVLAPKNSRPKVDEVIATEGDYTAFPKDDTVSFEMLSGMAEVEGAMLVKSADGITIVLNDAVFNMDRKTDPLGFLFTTVLGSAPGPRISRLAKLMLVKDKKALRRDLERYAELPALTRLVVAHEKVASGADAALALRTAATFL
jgi:hypothetical protein